MHLIIIVCCIIKIVYCAINNNTEIINNYIVNTISTNDHKHPVRLFNYVFPHGLGVALGGTLFMVAASWQVCILTADLIV